MNIAARPSLIVLTGAGISAESGLGTFRDEDGIWTKYPLEDLATPEGFARNPDFVHGFYNDRRRQLKTAKHHAGHAALARLQSAWEAQGGQFLLVTQNVDNLHEQAGSSGVVHMHGELNQIRCMACDRQAEWHDDIDRSTRCAACGRAGDLRPHVVWFGEMPLDMDLIADALVACDIFVAIGTSGQVYPAAGFVAEALAAGALTVELNLEPSDNAYVFQDGRYGPASEIVPAWVDDFLS
ncbi:MAG: NAD-dependent deacylase [Pseudomonadota bacterium]